MAAPPPSYDEQQKVADTGYPPAPQQGYPPAPQQGGYPPPPQQGGYPPQPGYPPQQGQVTQQPQTQIVQTTVVAAQQPPPPGCEAGGVWGVQDYCGPTTLIVIGGVIFFTLCLPVAFLGFCPLDQRRCYRAPNGLLYDSQGRVIKHPPCNM